MPHVRINRTAGARREITYLGVSEQGGPAVNDRRTARALREKRALVRAAQRLIQPDAVTDWNAACQRMRRLQKRWKALASAGEKQDERLYLRFKKACERFQLQRREHFQALGRCADANAVLKEELIVETQNVIGSGDPQASRRFIAGLIDRWGAIGHAGLREQGLLEQFNATRRMISRANSPGLASQNLQVLRDRVQRQRGLIDRLEERRSDLTARRRQAPHGWMGIETVEEIEERIAAIDAELAARAKWLRHETREAARATDRVNAQA